MNSDFNEDQIDLADRQKFEMAKTAQNMDEAIASLRKGNPLSGIPKPPTDEIRDRIGALEVDWACPVSRSSPGRKLWSA